MFSFRQTSWTAALLKTTDSPRLIFLVYTGFLKATFRSWRDPKRTLRRLVRHLPDRPTASLELLCRSSHRVEGVESDNDKVIRKLSVSQVHWECRWGSADWVRCPRACTESSFRRDTPVASNWTLRWTFPRFHGLLLAVEGVSEALAARNTALAPFSLRDPPWTHRWNWSVSSHGSREEERTVLGREPTDSFLETRENHEKCSLLTRKPSRCTRWNRRPDRRNHPGTPIWNERTVRRFRVVPDLSAENPYFFFFVAVSVEVLAFRSRTKSRNCPWMSPTIVTGGEIIARDDSLLNTSVTISISATSSEFS